jgi:thioesterase domain-containing protein
LGPKEKLDYVRQIKNRIWQTADVTRAPLPSALQLVTEANIQALIEYVPQVYQGRITLFRASERSQRTHRNPDLGWGELAVGGVEIFDVPGDHATLIEEPRVQILAEQLKVCLGKAQANGREFRVRG